MIMLDNEIDAFAIAKVINLLLIEAIKQLDAKKMYMVKKYLFKIIAENILPFFFLFQKKKCIL